MADEVAELEELLHSQLTPITARPVFIHTLGKRLSGEISPETQAKRQRAYRLTSLWQRILLAGAGVLSGSVLIVLAVRAILSIRQDRRTV